VAMEFLNILINNAMMETDNPMMDVRHSVK
jgi:hypothetical protein